MSEKRRPDKIILLSIPGKKKKNKIEIFKAQQWGWHKNKDGSSRKVGQKYRIRINGKWWRPSKDDDRMYFLWKHELKTLIMRSLGF